jgi:branched-chain amino acid transport system ATP-binding protein
MLEIRNLTVRYGGLTALSDVSLTVAEHSFVALIGANGAGKSSLFKAISGIANYTGTVTFDRTDLGPLVASQRARLGIAHVPEGRHVFKSMSVYENIVVGSFLRPSEPIQDSTVEELFALFPRLKERRAQLAGTLSGGEQQMLAIARALAGHPRVLMLDEPSMGLAPTVVDEIFECVSRLRSDKGLTVILVEQRAVEALELCDEGYLLQNGKIVLHGSPAQLISDARVKGAYVGA